MVVCPADVPRFTVTRYLCLMLPRWAACLPPLPSRVAKPLPCVMLWSIRSTDFATDMNAKKLKNFSFFRS